jgi:hypothetical protein
MSEQLQQAGNFIFTTEAYGEYGRVIIAAPSRKLAWKAFNMLVYDALEEYGFIERAGVKCDEYPMKDIDFTIHQRQFWTRRKTALVITSARKNEVM